MPIRTWLGVRLEPPCHRSPFTARVAVLESRYPGGAATGNQLRQVKAAGRRVASRLRTDGIAVKAPPPLLGESRGPQTEANQTAFEAGAEPRATAGSVPHCIDEPPRDWHYTAGAAWRGLARPLSLLLPFALLASEAACAGTFEWTGPCAAGLCLASFQYPEGRARLTSAYT